MTELEKRIQQVEDRIAISELKAAYCDGCDDDHNGETVSALFSEGGHWEYYGEPAHIGRDNIKTHFDSIRSTGIMRKSAHMIFNPVLKIDGDKASGSWRFQMVYTDQEGTVHQIIGNYKDTYVRNNCDWQFESLIATVEQRNPPVA